MGGGEWEVQIVSVRQAQGYILYNTKYITNKIIKKHSYNIFCNKYRKWKVTFKIFKN